MAENIDCEVINTAISEIENIQETLENKITNVRNLIIKHITNGEMALLWLEKYINLSDYCEINKFMDVEDADDADDAEDADNYINISYGYGSDNHQLVLLAIELLEPYFEIGDINHSDESIDINLTKKIKGL